MLAELLVVPCPESDHVGCLPPKSLKIIELSSIFRVLLDFCWQFREKTDPALNRPCPKTRIWGPEIRDFRPPKLGISPKRRRSQRAGSVFLLNCRSFSVKFLKIVELSSVFRVLVDFCWQFREKTDPALNRPCPKAQFRAVELAKRTPWIASRKPLRQTLPPTRPTHPTPNARMDNRGWNCV